MSDDLLLGRLILLMSFGLSDHGEAEPFVEASGWVDFDDLEIEAVTKVPGLPHCSSQPHVFST
jgi:hypothetical protein